jgi:hypothetical protein
LSGTLNPEGSPGYAFFLWGLTSTLSWGVNNNTNLQPVVVNFTSQSFTATLSGLTSGTIYFYQMGFYDTNNGTYLYGPVLSFTAALPVLITDPPNPATSSGASLNGRVNPAGSPGYAFFLWGLTSTLSWGVNSNTNLQPVVANFTPWNFTATVSGLTSGTTYYYQVGFYDTNNGTYLYGPVVSFETPLPAFVTGLPNPVTSSGATLNGRVNPEGSPGYAFFLWGLTSTLSWGVNSNTNLEAVVANFTAQRFTGTISGLTSGTIYFYQMGFYDTNNGTYLYGPVLSFKALEPVNITQPATSITSSGASLNGTVNPEGSPGYAFFLWGLTSTLSWGVNSNTNEQPVVADFTAQNFAATISNLASGTTYYYQIGFYDTNNSIYLYGPVLSFTTLQ